MTDITFRTEDLTRWGAGKGSNLSPTEFDLNNWWLYEAILALQAHPENGVWISDFSVLGNQMTILMTDGTTRGPYSLPVTSFTFRGPWAATTGYSKFDLITSQGGLYQILIAHTSSTTFDPNATDGSGNNLYALWLAFPAVGVQTKSGATYEPILSDANTYMRMTYGGGGCIVTIPPESTVNFPVGTELHFRDATATGPVVFDAVSPVVINRVHGYLEQTAVPGATVTLKKVGADEWDIFGLLAAGSP
jgi:hypothetical protein